MRTSGWLLLAGCTGPTLGIADPPSGTFAIGVAAAQPDDYEIDEFWVTIDEVVLDADGPSGPESVAVLLDHRYTPLVTRDAVGFDLEVGNHAHGRLQLSVLADDGPGLDVSATADDDQSIQILVDEVDLAFDLPDLTIDKATPLVGRVRFHPNEWVKEADDNQGQDGETNRDSGDDLVIDASSGKLYDRVLKAIQATTTFDFGPPATTSPSESTTESESD